MANIKITDLPAAGPITGTETVPIVQEGITVRTTTAAIAGSPAQQQTFITLSQEPTLPNSRYLSTGTGLGLTDGGALSTYTISLSGASGSLEAAGTGFIVKTGASTVASRNITVSGSGLSISNGDGQAGNPTISLSGNALSLANASGNGLLTLSSGGSIGQTFISGTSNQISVANGTGISGSPTISLASDPSIPGNAGMVIPVGTTAQQPVGTNGQIRFNSDTGTYDGYSAGSWKSFFLGIGSGVITFSGGSTGLTPSSATSGAITLGGTLAVANGGTGVTTSTGTGNNVLSSSPTLVTPNLGVPTFITLTNATDLPLTTGVTGILSASNGGTGLAAPGTVGNVLTSTGSTWVSSPPASANVLSFSGGTTGLTPNVATTGAIVLSGVLSVSNGGTGTTTSTGTGNLVLATGPAITLDNATGLPLTTGVTGTLPVANGGTGATTASAARTSLGAAASGANSDITSLSGLTTALSVNQGGTGVTTSTGTGSVVLSDSPTLVTPNLGTPASGVVTNLTGTASININGTVGATTPNTGNFTSLSASGTVSGTGFSTYLASPPAIGGTAPAAGTFTTLTATGQTSLGGAAGSEAFRAVTTASAVNWVQVAGSVTGSNPTFSAQGSDANIGLAFNSKGTGLLNFQTNGTTRATINSGAVFTAGILASGNPAFIVSPTASQVNYLQATGSAATQAPVLSSQGTDTNISQVFQSKGTGAIDLAAGTSGVNISNGGTVTAITVTNQGSTYSSAPTVAITASTTAGGVQATANAVMSGTGTIVITNGGTGYSVNDVLTFVGGTGSAESVTVTAVSGGVITAAAFRFTGQYTVVPTNPISVTGGTGAGATFTCTWKVISFSITAAGSGYVEQPTITFSSGTAAAYATVGSGTVVKSLGSTMSFYTPGGEQARIEDTYSGGTAVNYVRLRGRAAGAGPIVYVGGSDTNATLNLASAGTGSVTIGTNSGGTTQMQIVNTASAVNYVQVTGSVTGAPASALGGLLMTGSDASPNLGIGTKGSGYIAFYGGGASNAQSFRVINTNAASTGNLIAVQGAAAGSSPSIQAVNGFSGTDANVDINLITKGTGAVNFNTGTTSALQFQVADTASAVNYVQVTGAITANRPRINFTGSDANVGGTFITKGSGTILFASDANAGTIQFGVFRTASSVNYIAAAGAATTASPSFTSTGSDANIDLSLTPKGTGLVRFGTYTAGIITATGYINIKAADGTTYKMLVST